VLDQRLLAAAVAGVHAADLRHGLVRLVDDQQEVVGEVVEQRGRRLAGRPAAGRGGASSSRCRCRSPSPRASRGRNIVRCSSRCASSSLPAASSSLEAACSSTLMPWIARLQLRCRGDVVRGREDRHLARRPAAPGRAAGRSRGCLDLVAEELDADRGVVLVGREDLDHVAAHPEGAAVEVESLRSYCISTSRRSSCVARSSVCADLELEVIAHARSRPPGEPMP
jgi:hypothetical protein